MDPWIAFYKRYINDCLGLVYSCSLQEVLTIMQVHVNIDGCVITAGITLMLQGYYFSHI